MVGESADRDVAVAAFEPLQTAVAIGEDVAFGRGDADGRDSGGLLAGVPEVDGPKDEQFAADDGVGVPVAVGPDADLFVGGKSGAVPSRHPWLRIRGDRAGE